MLENFDYSLVPYGFVHCFEGKCRQAEHCLRYLTTRYIPKECLSVSIVNPARLAIEGDCPAFLSAQPIKYAWGVDRMLDNLSHKQSKKVKQAMIDHFGKAMFYRIKRKERGLSPKEQQAVAYLFQRCGIKENPMFDKYEDAFMWE